MKAIQLLEVSERPREKLGSFGAERLSDEELLAIMLGSGSRRGGVQTLAKQVLRLLDTANSSPSLEELEQIPGIGKAKATLILSALEFSRRRIRPKGLRIREAKDLLPLLSHWTNRDKEHFITVTLNGAHEVIKTRVITVGLINSSQVHAREVFAPAITDRACALVIAHNHPSGDLTPSEADRKVTRVLCEAGKLLGITVLDHLIFSERGFYSFQESGDCIHVLS